MTNNNERKFLYMQNKIREKCIITLIINKNEKRKNKKERELQGSDTVNRNAHYGAFTVLFGTDSSCLQVRD